MKYLEALNQATKQFIEDFRKAWDNPNVQPTYNNQGRLDELIYFINRAINRITKENHPTIYLWYNPDDDTLQELTEDEAKEAKEEVTPFEFDSLDIHFIVYPY